MTLHVDDVASPVVQLAELRNRKYDFVLARIRGPLVDGDVNVEILFNDQVVIAADARSRWLRRRKIDLPELVDEPWLLTPPDGWVYSRLAEAFAARGLDMPKANVLTVSVPLRNHLLADSQHLSAFANSVLRLNAERYGLKALPVDLPQRPWPAVVVTPRNRTLSPLVERFIECARDVVKSIAGKSRGEAAYRQGPHVS